MKKSSYILFFVKLFFYLSTALLVYFHPGISIRFDRLGILLWFVIIPLEGLIAFLPAPKGKFRYKLLTALLLLVVTTVINGSFGVEFLILSLAGTVSFILNFLLFHYPRWGKLAFLEPFFVAWVSLRLLIFSRSGEEAAGISLEITQFILVWAITAFLFQCAAVYLILNPKSIKGIKKEGTAGFLAGLGAIILFVLVLPPDFIKNTIVENLKQETAERLIKDSSEHGIPMEGRRRSGRRSDHGNNELRGIPEANWLQGGSWRERRRRGEGGEPRQYAVKVVASGQEPVYMGDSFNGKLDPQEGFLQSPEENLNNLPSMRLFVAWHDSSPFFDLKRYQQEVFSLSTLSTRYLPYRPLEIQPAILSENSGPFRYIHRITSNMHEGEPLELIFAPGRSLSMSERNRLSSYLELNLYEDDFNTLKDYFDKAMENWRNNIREEIIKEDDFENEFLEKIFAIMMSFTEYQYNIEPGDRASVSEIIEFLYNEKEGDCVKFSHSLALLGRIAGIPSRVVTGYLAAEELQSPAHLRGLENLQRNIPVLQEFPFEELFLVTDLHAHSWAQFYIPDYGWLDFEATAFAIPPVGSLDFNSWDVVIPIIDPDKYRLLSQVRNFPWRAVFIVLGWFFGGALAAVYLLRYAREAVLYFKVHGKSKSYRNRARSLYLLLLAKLAAEGNPVKPASKTAAEYASLFPNKDEAFLPFAEIYSKLRWREFENLNEGDVCFLQLTEEYNKILLREKKKGVKAFLRRIFSLRGLAYL